MSILAHVEGGSSLLTELIACIILIVLFSHDLLFDCLVNDVLFVLDLFLLLLAWVDEDQILTDILVFQREIRGLCLTDLLLKTCLLRFSMLFNLL